MRRLLNSGPRQDELEQHLTDDVIFHREQCAADLQSEGWSAEDARREAQRRVGFTNAWVAAALAEDTLPWVTTWWRETRQALRGLRRRPWLVLTVVLTLSVGIGVLLAALTVVDRLLFAALPFPASDRLVVLDEAINGEQTGGNPSRTADWGRALHGIEAVAGVYGDQLVLTRSGEAQRVQALRGVGPLTQVFQWRPALGRAFTRDEEREGAAVAMLTDRGWQRLFGRDPRVLEAPVTLRGETYRLVGVLGPDMDYPTGTDLIAPAGPGFQRAPRGGNWLQVVARLEPGQTTASVQDEARAVARRFAELYPEHDRGLTVRLVPLQAHGTRDLRTPVWLLLAAAVTVFLVVCVNIGGLLLVRALARDQESAIRNALGASRWAMLRLTLHEASILGLLAMPVAWLFAGAILAWLVQALQADVPDLQKVALGWRALGVGAGVLILTVMLLAAWPAWHVATRGAKPLAATHAVTDATSRRRVRRALVCVQVACSTMLVVLALLLSDSLREMVERPRGFDSERVLVVRYDLDWEQPKSQIDEMTARVTRLASEVSGVTSVGVVDRLPLQGGTQSAQLQIYGEPDVPAGRPDVSVRSATPDYFRTLGVPVLAGRVFVDDAARPERREVVVNAAFARTYFPDRDPLGQRLAVRWEPGPPSWLEVVGVVGDLRRELREDAAAPEVYRPWSQAFWPLLHVTVRTDGSPDVLGRLQRHLLRTVPGQPIAMAGTLEGLLAENSRQPRTLMTLMTACALAAALLAMVGLYGLLASEMLGRRREIGIRLALGARPWGLRARLLVPALALTVAGIGLGLVLSVPAARALQSQLFGVGAGDWLPRVAAAAMLTTTGLMCGLVPAIRLVSEQALLALRYE